MLPVSQYDSHSFAVDAAFYVSQSIDDFNNIR